METIIFIGTYTTGTNREAMKKAKCLGYHTILFTNRRRYLKQKHEFPEVDQMFFVTHLSNFQNLNNKIQNIKTKSEIKAIISFIDPYVSIATRLSNKFCGTNFSVTAIETMENKIKTREALKNTSFNINFFTFSTSESNFDWLPEGKLKFPAVIKLPKSCGSSGVFLVENHDMFIDRLANMKQEYPNRTLLIEEYFEGEQYLVEVIVTKGKVQPVVIIKQDISFNQRFIVTGYRVIQNLPTTFYNHLVQSIRKILCNIGLKNGTCHLELRLKANQWKLIEINPRMAGGAMNQIIEAAHGIDLVEETINFYLKDSCSLSNKKKENVYAYYFTSSTKGIVKGIRGIHKALQVPGVIEVNLNIKKGDRVSPPLSMGQRLGYILATGSSIETAEQSAKKAAELIKIYLQSSNSYSINFHLKKE